MSVVKNIEENTITKKEVTQKRLLRMKDLMAATGLPKSAILHYLAQGLLPEPEKTGPNMAYYDPSCIERIKFVKDMQAKYSFPLSKIKMLLDSKDQGKEIAHLVDLSRVIFAGDDAPSMDEKTFCSSTGLNRKQVRELLDNGLLLPIEKGLFNQSDVEVGRFYAAGFGKGLELADIIFYSQLAKLLVDGEMRLRMRITADMPEDEDAETTKGLVQAARTIRNYVFERTFRKRVASASHLKDKEALIS
ncbi:MAG: MerR family transcriptional regulator [Dissulfurispiraceae bacterium]